MKIKSNTLAKIAVPVVLLLVVFISLKSCQSTDTKQSPSNNIVADVTPDELKTLGIDGDTPEDTLRTVVARLKAIQINQEQLEKINQALSAENNQLQQTTKEIDSRISQALQQYQNERSGTQQQMENKQQNLLQQAEHLLDSLKTQGKTKSTGSDDLPIGLGFENSNPAIPDLVWIEPQDGVAVDRNGQPTQQINSTNGFRFASSFLENNEITRQKAELDRVAKNQRALDSQGQELNALPVYTLPENSTLVGSKAMTALLGRVPIDGKVTDPYPFKILIGKDNLTANGIELPDIEGAIVSGTATGDWTLSCVRGEVQSITFVFVDGTVRTVPPPAKSTEGNNSKNNGGSIGWLSDVHGIPCISGERKSNASTYLPTLFALAGSTAAAEALAQNQTTTTVDGGTITNALTGDAGQYALGKTLSGGMQETSAWVKARYGQTFDAIYVPPGLAVAVHITKQITIDYEQQGRKVKYDFSLGQINGIDLD